MLSAMEEADSSASEKLRLLIVDDSAMVRSLVSEMVLGLPQFEIVGEAQDGREGLEMLRRLKPDLVTLDVTMPRMNGIEVLRALKNEGFAGP